MTTKRGTYKEPKVKKVKYSVKPLKIKKKK